MCFYFISNKEFAQKHFQFTHRQHRFTAQQIARHSLPRTNSKHSHAHGQVSARTRVFYAILLCNLVKVVNLRLLATFGCAIEIFNNSKKK